MIVQRLQREQTGRLIHLDGTALFEESGRRVDFLITLGPNTD